MSLWTVGWLLWIFGTIVGFVALEWPAIRRRVPGPDRDTLSDHVAEFRDRFPAGRWILRAVMLSGIGFVVVWLWPHFEKHRWDR